MGAGLRSRLGDTGSAPSPLLIATGESIPLRGLEGVPGLAVAPQEEAGLTRKFETSHVGLQAMQEKKALSSRGRGRLRGFLELRRPWGFSPEVQRADSLKKTLMLGKIEGRIEFPRETGLLLRCDG